MALFIVLEREVGFDSFVNGKAVARHAQQLDSLAARLKVTPLLEFFSADPNEVAAEFELEPVEVDWKEAWFSARDGLITVRTLLAHLRNNPNKFEDERVQEDLQEFEDVLVQTERSNIRWHLGIDS